MRNEFEDVLILETPYYKELKKTYRDTITFNRYIDILKKITGGDGFITMLEHKGGKELVYFGRKIFSLQEEFVTNYIQFLSDESLVSKWEKFFERYSKNLFEIFENFVSADSNKILIFEIVNRKVLRDLLTKKTMDVSIERKMLICERFGVVVNQLFNYMRNSLARNMTISDTLIVDSYGKVPLLPRCSHGETMRLLNKCFLQNGMPEALFMAIAKNIITPHYIDAKDRFVDLINKKTIFGKDDIIEAFKSSFFFPDDKNLAEILELLKAKARDVVNDIKKRKELARKKINDIKQKTEATANEIKTNLVDLAENFSTEESIDNMVNRLRRNLIANGYDLRISKIEYEEYTKKENELKNILNFKSTDLQKFVFKNEWDPYLILSLSKKRGVDSEQLQLIIKDVVAEIKSDKTTMEIMGKYRVSGFLKDKYNTDIINEKFQAVIEQVILPVVKCFLLEELIDYYPKLSGVVPGEGVRYLAEEALSGRVNMIEKDIKIVRRRDETISESAISQYKNLVSVFVYDIRGSTFMGTKLRDAKRENEIKNFFQESMLSIVEKYGGIPIKDTGDGGVVLFAANHREVKNRETFELKPGSVLSAVRSGLEMVSGAKKFVQENISKYQDWFRETEERRVVFEGATYATLPPSYQSIFQIGVGIASGVYPKEVYLDKNAYGELDLTGMLVREANFYSKVRAKEKSTVICDDATVYNLLLNTNKFSFLSEAGLRIDPMLLDIEQGLEYWINQRVTRRGFILDLYKIFVEQLGQEITRPGSLKIMLGIFDITIDETGEIKDDKGGRGKFLFEISSEATR